MNEYKLYGIFERTKNNTLIPLKTFIDKDNSQAILYYQYWINKHKDHNKKTQLRLIFIWKQNKIDIIDAFITSEKIYTDKDITYKDIKTANNTINQLLLFFDGEVIKNDYKSQTN